MWHIHAEPGKSGQTRAGWLPPAQPSMWTGWSGCLLCYSYGGAGQCNHCITQMKGPGQHDHSVLQKWGLISVPTVLLI